MITLVAGQTRCGSSLTMQMLIAAGMAGTGEPPGYEDNRYFSDLDAALGAATGKCMKALDPHRLTWPTDVECRAIWLHRDFNQQAKSNIKFMRLIAPELWRLTPHHRVLARSYREDQPKAVKVLMDVTRGRVLWVRFETLFGSTQADTVARIAKFVFNDFSRVPAMRSVIVDRSPRNYPGILEVPLLLRERRRS